MRQLPIEDTRAIQEFCQRNYIIRLALFGSVPRGQAREDSDLDVLVDFEPGHVPGFAFIRMQDELTQLFGGRSVDLLTTKFLNHRLRERVLGDAVVLYER